MKKFLVLFTLLSFVVFISCGPTEEEKEKAREELSNELDNMFNDLEDELEAYDEEEDQTEDEDLEDEELADEDDEEYDEMMEDMLGDGEEDPKYDAMLDEYEDYCEKSIKLIPKVRDEDKNAIVKFTQYQTNAMTISMELATNQLKLSSSQRIRYTKIQTELAAAIAILE